MDVAVERWELVLEGFEEEVVGSRDLRRREVSGWRLGLGQRSTYCSVVLRKECQGQGPVEHVGERYKGLFRGLVEKERPCNRLWRG